MAHPDPGPLLEEHLDELELICQAGENGGNFEEIPLSQQSLADDFDALDYVLGWYDRHARQLLEAAQWALEHGWQREPNTPT